MDFFRKAYRNPTRMQAGAVSKSLYFRNDHSAPNQIEAMAVQMRAITPIMFSMNVFPSGLLGNLKAFKAG